MAFIKGTDTFSVDAVGDPEPLVVPGSEPCSRVMFFDPDGVGKYRLYSAIGSDYAEFPPGWVQDYKRSAHQPQFKGGEILGYIAMVSGTATFTSLATDEQT